MPRGNPQNLIPTNKRSKEEARRISSNGGKKSGEVRRKRKALREELLALLSAGNTQKNISLALIDQALNGNVKAFETIRDTIGEKPVEKVVMSEVDPNVISEVEEMVKND
jgi:hypothetical protein